MKSALVQLGWVTGLGGGAQPTSYGHRPQPPTRQEGTKTVPPALVTTKPREAVQKPPERGRWKRQPNYPTTRSEWTLAPPVSLRSEMSAYWERTPQPLPTSHLNCQMRRWIIQTDLGAVAPLQSFWLACSEREIGLLPKAPICLGRVSSSLAILLLTLIPQTPATARTWIIAADGSGDAPTVQAGIDSAGTGETVLLGPGTFYENVNMTGKAIELSSQFGPGSATLDGSHGDGPVITCDSGERNGTIITGITITGGAGISYLSNRLGGGIYCDNASPVIRGNVICGNNVVGAFNSRGAGIYIGPTETNAIIEGNTLEDNYSSGNGGCINIGGPCVVQDNIIRYNRTGGGDGAGIRYVANSPAVIRRNVILGNTANDHGGGIYILNNKMDPSEIDISLNIIINNVANGADAPGAPDCSGGGIWLTERGAHIHNNTIAFNRAYKIAGSFASVGGICEINPSSEVVVERNILYHNLDGAVGVYGLSNDASIWIATFRQNIIYDNGKQDVYSDTFDPRAMIHLMLDGNIFDDPLFCSAGVGAQAEVAGASPALNQPFGVIGAAETPGCGPYIAKIGTDLPPDPTLCSCMFPDAIAADGGQDTVRAVVASDRGPIQALQIRAYLDLESGAFSPKVQTTATGTTDRLGRAEMVFGAAISGQGQFYITVVAGGMEICRSEPYTMNSDVTTIHTTWGRLKARYQ